MEWQSLTREECVRRLGSDARNGLSPRQVSRKQEQYGKNRLAQKKKKSLVRRFFAQFADFMVMVLLAAAAVSFVTSYWQGDADFVDSIIILAIVVINAVTGLVQESRAEKAIEALKKLSSPESRVIREGRRTTVPTEDLVPGDIVLLNTGDLIPADLRILEAHGLKAEESALTGESAAAEKEADAVCPENTPLGDRKNMLFASGSIAGGHGAGIVVATAMETQMGRIARMIDQEESPRTPLQQRLAQTGKLLGTGAVLICLLIFVMGLFQKVQPLEMFLISISLAVAAIPEGLPAVVTIVLAMGVRRMAANRAIVRHLPAVETLGSASVICSDKTGTLTQNQMTVTELGSAEGSLERDSREGKRLLELAALCTNCVVSGEKVRGDPTEAAILYSSPRSREELEREFPRIAEIPFTSARKMMTTVHRVGKRQYRVIVKGAPDLLLPRCAFCRVHSADVPVTETVGRALRRKNDEMAGRALRVLGVAWKDVETLPAEGEMERGLTFGGFIGMMDPPRKEAAAAVRQCREAGIRPIMITGDHAATAAAVAGQLGILTPDTCVLSGAELERMDQSELEKNIYRYTVFARVSPEHKVRIVRAFQKRGEVAAMTGDGVNDAPALKAADIGCAMGLSGTEVAKAASDMILTDDNFATIVSAVREGRGIYDNIRKTVHFLLSCNIGELLTIFVAFLLGIPTPLLAIQLLWVNLVTDSLPALALGADPIDGEIMKRKPVRQNESLFAGGMIYHILVEGGLIGSLALLAYTLGRVFFDPDPGSPAVGRTMAFAVLSLSQVVHTFNMRSDRSVFSSGFFRNRKLLWAAPVCFCLQASVIVIPFLSTIFKTVPLSGLQWLIVLGLSLVPLVVVEAEKRVSAGKSHRIFYRNDTNRK